MSSLFSYELDEAKIRLTLKEAELQYSEEAWHSFESSYKTISAKTSSQTPFIKFNLNISRNVLLPIFFILGLTLLSAIIFSFIDLTPRNELTEPERAVIPNPENYKPKTNLAISTQKPDTLENKIKTNSLPVSMQDSAMKSEASIKNTESENELSKQNMNIPELNQDTVSNLPISKNYNNIDTSEKNPISVSPRQGKKRKKRKTPANVEQIEIIKAPSVLNLGNNSNDEPELKLR